MGSIAQVQASDGEDTAVLHTFNPIFVRNEGGKQVAFYRQDVSGVPLEAQPTLTVSQETLRSGLPKYSVRLVTPVMEAVNGQNAAGYTAPPKVAYSVTSEFVTYGPPRSTKQQRKNSRMMLAAIMLGVDTAWSAGILDNVGPAVELIDSGVSPT